MKFDEELYFLSRSLSLCLLYEFTWKQHACMSNQSDVDPIVFKIRNTKFCK